MSGLADRLDDTSRCPLGPRCEVCGGTDATALEVATATAMGGVLCLTLCDWCADEVDAGRRRLPTLSPVQAAGRIAAHCQHLGIDLDEMAAAVAAESTQGGPR